MSGQRGVWQFDKNVYRDNDVYRSENLAGGESYSLILKTINDSFEMKF